MAQTRSSFSKQVSLPYAAMCFSLLHEQDLFGIVFQMFPEWWDEHTLEDLQRKLWGFLSDAG